jgi:hypothetical protein
LTENNSSSPFQSFNRCAPFKPFAGFQEEEPDEGPHNFDINAHRAFAPQRTDSMATPGSVNT